MSTRARGPAFALFVAVLSAVTAHAEGQHPEDAIAQSHNEPFQRLELMPDLTVDRIDLDERCQIVISLRNAGGSIAAEQYEGAILLLEVGERRERFYLAQGQEDRPAVDAEGALRRSESSFTFSTGITLQSPANVRAILDPDRSVHESNARRPEGPRPELQALRQVL